MFSNAWIFTCICVCDVGGFFVVNQRSCWKNSWVTGYLSYHDVHVTAIYLWYLAQPGVSFKTHIFTKEIPIYNGIGSMQIGQSIFIFNRNHLDDLILGLRGTWHSFGPCADNSCYRGQNYHSSLYYCSLGSIMKHELLFTIHALSLCEAKLLYSVSRTGSRRCLHPVTYRIITL